MKLNTLKFEKIDQIAKITINRPENFNTLNSHMSNELLKVAISCDEDENIKAIILTGSGDKSFCAGGDLFSFKNSGSKLSSEVKEFIISLHGAISKFCRLKAPIIASINGVAAGAGLSFASFPSLAIASTQATFVSSYTNIGLTPDGSSSYFLPKLIGQRRYMELVLTNRTLSAEEALDWGLINKVVKPEKLDDETMKIANFLSRGPLSAHGRIKDLVLNSYENSLEDQLELEARFFTNSLNTDEFKDRLSAFTSKDKKK